MNRPRVLSVGQCGFDHSMIARRLQQALGAETVAARDAAEALTALRSGAYDLVLVNRVNDRDGSPGLDLIRALKGDPGLAGVPVMLVSDYPDAQADAIALGAVPGFGKSRLNDPRAIEALKSSMTDAP